MLRAVLVDDSADLRYLTRVTLELEGAAEVVGEAADGVEGLDQISQLTPDVAVIDIHMPGLDGVDLIKYLRHVGCNVRLVAYSADDLGLRDALVAGADAAVLKTASLDELTDAVTTHRGAAPENDDTSTEPDTP